MRRGSQLAQTIACAALISACATSRPAPPVEPEVRREAAAAVAAVAAVEVTEVAAERTSHKAEGSSRRVSERIARSAASQVGHKSLRGGGPGISDDCTGLVRWSFLVNGVDVGARAQPSDEGFVGSLYELAARAGALHRRSPRPGDLVFFRETYDRNRDGERDDGLTHVGVVESVDALGTVLFVHRGGTGIKRSALDPSRPGVREDADGNVVNDYLRRAEGDEPGRLAGELFAGYADTAKLVRSLGGPQKVARAAGRTHPERSSRR